jgi:hypothetical protein
MDFDRSNSADLPIGEMVSQYHTVSIHLNGGVLELVSR